MQKLPPVSIKSPLVVKSTLVVAETCRMVGAALVVTSTDPTEDIDESSSVVSAVCTVLSIVTLRSINSSGKSWTVLGENGLSQKSMSDPGGGGPKVVKRPVALLEVDETDEESVLVTDESLDESERFRRLNSGMFRSESVDEIVLSSSGAVGSVIKADCCSYRLFRSIIRSRMLISIARFIARCCLRFSRRRHIAAVFLSLFCRKR